MAVSKFKLTDPGHLAIRKGQINMETDSFIWVLIDSDYVTNLLVDDVYSKISANECTDADYDQVVGSGFIWAKTGDRTFSLDASDVDFGNAVTVSARYLYLVKDANTDGVLAATDQIIGFYDLNDGGTTNVSSVNGNFDLNHSVSGLLTETLTPAV